MTARRGIRKNERIYSLSNKGDIVAWSLLTLDERIEAREARYKRLYTVKRLYGSCSKCGRNNEPGWRHCAACGWSIDDIPF